ncbi:Fatty acyl-CoA reductase 1 [Hypsibius exemplaris]|uniref:Fatty acyl-CoA reductase n=1 Tax=Hypsibius exemplaris TaxID=2072580 RepID=A0A1W0X9D0_HYPEX|nr:Fatty acyl-CoA reductase 1 [Hypsibius exemplaris]
MATIVDFYKGKSVFITGGTGFMGKVLIQRLLTCCPDIQRIYVLVRSTAKESSQERLTSALSTVAFKDICMSDKENLRKVCAISGDMVGVDLGIRHDDLQMLFESVSVVFHTAATVKFDEALKTAIEVNVSGTKKLLALCHEMRQLEAIVHVSTAYSNCHLKKIEEKIYPSPIQPNQLIDALQWMDEGVLKAMTPGLIPPWPNTYTYAKALAETIIISDGSNLKIGIVRPSIVGAAMRFPFPGYIDNYNGPSGLLAAIGKGALRTMLGNRNAIADIVPVDYAVDLMIAVPWHLVNSSSREPQVYNFTSGSVNPLTWGYVQDSTLANFRRNPVDCVYRIPAANFTQNKIVHTFWTLFDHLLPAHLSDLVLMAQGKKPTVVRSYGKLHRALKSLDYFTQGSWDFRSDNVAAIWQSLPLSDRKVFDFELSNLSWKDYMEKFCLGVKVYLLHERLDRLPQARQNFARRVSITRTVLGIVAVILVSIICRKLKLLRHSWVVSLTALFRMVVLLSRLLSSRK